MYEAWPSEVSLLTPTLSYLSTSGFHNDSFPLFLSQLLEEPIHTLGEQRFPSGTARDCLCDNCNQWLY
jgi:hypothetical protein